jgi:hypothetical protein
MVQGAFSAAATWHLVDETAMGRGEDSEPMEFETAFAKAQNLQQCGRSVMILYTEGASQIEITRFVSHGIRATLVSGA